MERQYNHKMKDIIYLVEYNIVTDHLVIHQLCKQFDEDYDEMMYIGSDIEDRYGYFMEDIELNKLNFNSKIWFQYFTDNIEYVEKHVLTSKTFEFFKSIEK